MSLKLLYDDFHKKVLQVNVDKFNYLKESTSIKLNEDSYFLPKEIQTYIESKLKTVYKINYKYKNIKIKLDYNTTKNVSKEFFKELLYRIVFLMTVCNKFINLNLIIYDTPFKKKFDCSKYDKCKKILGPDNINSGYSYTNNIVIFRKEELTKLIIHETIHCLDIDVKHEDSKLNKHLQGLFCIKSRDFLVNESYVETWSSIIHVFLLNYYKFRNYDYDIFKKTIQKQIMFSLNQSAKILTYYSINKYEDVLKTNGCKTHIIENTNVFSYHILKTVNLVNINNFIKNFRSYKTPHILEKYSYPNYIRFLESKHLTIQDKINKVLKKTTLIDDLNLRMVLGLF